MRTPEKGLYEFYKGGVYELVGIANTCRDGVEDSSQNAVLYKFKEGVSFCVVPLVQFTGTMYRDGVEVQTFKPFVNSLYWETDLTGTFTYVKGDLMRMVGYTPDEWVGTNLSAHCSKAEYTKLFNKIVEAIRIYTRYGAREPLLFNSFFSQKRGGLVSVTISGRLMLSKGEPFGVKGLAASN